MTSHQQASCEYCRRAQRSCSRNLLPFRIPPTSPLDTYRFPADVCDQIRQLCSGDVEALRDVQLAASIYLFSVRWTAKNGDPRDRNTLDFHRRLNAIHKKAGALASEVREMIDSKFGAGDKPISWLFELHYAHAHDEPTQQAFGTKDLFRELVALQAATKSLRKHFRREPHKPRDYERAFLEKGIAAVLEKAGIGAKKSRSGTFAKLLPIVYECTGIHGGTDNWDAIVAAVDAVRDRSFGWCEFWACAQESRAQAQWVAEHKPNTLVGLLPLK
jgi:hypothetical protein